MKKSMRGARPESSSTGDSNDSLKGDVSKGRLFPDVSLFPAAIVLLMNYVGSKSQCLALH